MKKTYFKIANTPALLFGEPSDELCIFLHGQGGNKETAEPFAHIAGAHGIRVLGIDLPGHGERTDAENFIPQAVVPELARVGEYARHGSKRVSLRADSIGAWFGMLAFAEMPLARALLVSPLLDMERVIQNMMLCAGVSPERLQKELVIPTGAGQTLSWEYLTWVREHPVSVWNTPTKILYPDRDNLTDRGVAEDFARRFGCELTVAEDCEHWFHTPPQLAVLDEWTRAALRLPV